MAIEFGSAIVGAVAQYMIRPVVRQFGYLFCYKSNMETMVRQRKRLDLMRKGVRQSVDASRRNQQEITPLVEEWLVNVDKVTADMDCISQSFENNTVGCFSRQCLNLKSRYVLSRRAKKKTGVAVQLQDEGESYVCVSNPMLLVGMDFFSGRTYINFSSRKSTEDNIVAALKDASVNIIGVCGMGGVGKTTMVKTIAERMKKEKLFDEVVMAVVSQQPDMRKIQGEIAELLDLKLEGESLLARASRLRSRLRNVKRILVILDDVWGRLDLAELGIPSHKGCKVMLTSRIRDVCVATDAERVLTVEVLSGEEGWTLFTKLAGKSIEAPALRRIAEKVVDECKGLPIALVTVGIALRNKPIPVWNDALLQLRKALPINIPGMLADVYRPLKLSYTHLQSDEAKSLFLLCCLFQEDFNIPIEDLTRYGMGLRMFLGIENLEEARNRANSLVEMLKDRFLLIQGYSSSHVKMHDLIRDVAIFIASQDNQAFMISHNVNLEEWPVECSSSAQPYTCISFISKAITVLPGRLDCPKLELLQLECSKQPLEAPDSFFKGMTALKVLDMCAMNLLSLPSSLGFLTNLRVLHLYSCSLENIIILGKLTNLEVLSFRGSLIKVLPAEVGKLTKLRLLDMSGCDDLTTIAANVISSLTRLEELRMGRNFNFKWAALGEGNEGRNIAALSELEALPSLTTLEIQVPDSRAIPINMHLSSKLTKYAISIRDVLPKNVDKRFQRAMYLFLPTMTPLANWIQVTLRGAEYLNLTGEGSINAVKALVPDGFQHGKVLKIHSCDVLDYLVDTVNRFMPGATIFPALESLDLCNLASLQQLCCGQLPLGSFSSLKELKLDLLDSLENLLIGTTEKGSLANLRSICISRCRRLQYLFPHSTLVGLLHLEEIKISDCEIMQEVFPGDGVDRDVITARFDSMRICLVDLPNLVTICKGIPYVPHLYASQGPQIVEEQDFPVASFPR